MISLFVVQGVGFLIGDTPAIICANTVCTLFDMYDSCAYGMYNMQLIKRQYDYKIQKYTRFARTNIVIFK